MRTRNSCPVERELLHENSQSLRIRGIIIAVALILPEFLSMPISDFKSYLRHLTEQPGIYQILDSQGTVLYVGKARNLKRRVSQYFHTHLANPKTFALMQQADHIEVIITQTEAEALFLENSLIKDKKPRYNVLLKDDKSYPYIYLSQGTFPRLDFYRGSKRQTGRYFGPYTSAAMVRKNLNLLQKLFKIRQCEDSFFKHRKRPCLQYHIDRCTAPCVGYVDSSAYQQQVQDAVWFLEGKNHLLIAELERRMQQEAAALRYEKASIFRDQIQALKAIQEKQYVVDQVGEFDIVTLVASSGTTCIGVLRIREGRLLDQHEYFPKTPDTMSQEEVLSSFLSQYYLNVVPMNLFPKQIGVNLELPEGESMCAALSEYAGKKIKLNTPKRGRVYEWIKWGLNNTTYALNHQLATKTSYTDQLEKLQALLNLPSLPKRIECFDISHSGGECTVASNVVFGEEGPMKGDYRRFNISNLASKGDDYAAMKAVLLRRYGKVQKDTGIIPDLVMVDGGKGQLNAAVQVLETLPIKKPVNLVAIAKGEGRKPGFEKLWQPGKRSPLTLSSDSGVLHLLQRIRDEAHRFAITGHRKQRDKKRSHSFLEEIPGVGAKRRRLLLSRFGGLQQLKEATLDELTSLPGFNLPLAKRIYNYLH